MGPARSPRRLLRPDRGALLNGRTAIVVGGGQSPGATLGNGRAVAEALAAAGARVLVVDRDLAAAQETVKAIAGQAWAYQADVTHPGAAAGILAAGLDRLGGRIDILHNNVGVVVAEPTERTSRADWQQALDVNLTGLWAICREVLPVMRAQGSGVVVNISSLAGVLPGATPYAVSKAGVNALTQGLALEYAPHGVRVNAIVPGIIDTPMGVDRVAELTGRRREEIAEYRASLVPMGRQGSAHDIAAAALFLMSEPASFITGAVLPVDGGSSLRGNVF